jgi:hypothetical protein
VPPAQRLEFLHVAKTAPGGLAQLVDEQGRTVILRGTNLRGLEDDYYPGAGPQPQYPVDPASYEGTCSPPRQGAGEPPVCEVDAAQPEYEQPDSFGSGNDLAEIRSQGFDFIRLPVSWSLLEP